MPFTRCFIKCIGQSSKNRWEGGFTQTGWVYIAFDKMHINGSWRFFHSDQPVFVKIIHLWFTLPEGHGSIHRVADAVHDGTR